VAESLIIRLTIEGLICPARRQGTTRGPMPPHHGVNSVPNHQDSKAEMSAKQV